jgi:alpha-galactosidase
VVFSICGGGDNQPWMGGKDVGHVWRTFGDIHPCWVCEVGHGSWWSWGVLRIIDRQVRLRVHAGPRQWNDPATPEVGKRMTESEACILRLVKITGEVSP